MAASVAGIGMEALYHSDNASQALIYSQLPLAKGDYRGCDTNQSRPPAAKSAASPLEKGDKCRNSRRPSMTAEVVSVHQAGRRSQSDLQFVHNSQEREFGI